MIFPIKKILLQKQMRLSDLRKKQGRGSVGKYGNYLIDFLIVCNFGQLWEK